MRISGRSVPVASALTITAGREEIIDFSDPYFGDISTDEQYGLGFPEGSALREVVNAALQEIKNGCAYAKIYREWIGGDSSLSADSVRSARSGASCRAKGAGNCYPNEGGQA